METLFNTETTIVLVAAIVIGVWWLKKNPNPPTPPKTGGQPGEEIPDQPVKEE